MLVQEIIARKRDRLKLNADQLRTIVGGIASADLPDAQAAAFAMAVVLNGMDREETVALTLAMRDSGRTLAWDLPGPVVDKHSTGGVGDKVSLVLAPVLAACGAFVPMISGRGLGHTGGTLDKLEAIPGYHVRPDLSRLQQVVGEVGCAIIGASDDLAPADRRLYAIRDVTATVESVPLITASILAKKLAAGLDALVMDVKVGSGAFLPSLGAARELATSLTEVGEGAGLDCRALLTDMNQCLGTTAGNALEVKEALAMLAGEPVDWRLDEVVVALAATVLVQAGIDGDENAAAERAQAALSSGAAAERFERMVQALGGPVDLVRNAERLLPAASVVREVPANAAGFVAGIDVRALGWTVVELGGGRRSAEQRIDPAVGLSDVLGIGDRVEAGQALACIHARSEADAEVALARLAKAFVLAEEAPPAPDLFKPLEAENPSFAKPGETATPRPVPRRFGRTRRGR
ncbi:MAG: thymidine phosphorylase [Geminicoccaceae bacterium]|nr:MAG: thymidine phosphorylase [Geminicoccaceae bacterium]